MTLVLLAWRNLVRSRRRTAITVSSIAVGLAALTFVWGFIDGMNEQMVENTTRYLAGDLQVHVAGYHDDPTLDRAMTNGAEVARIIASQPVVAAVAPRLESRFLAARDDKARGVLLVGVSPTEETSVTDLHKAVIAGSALSVGASDGALIGVQIAEALGLEPGDDLVLVGQAYDGSVASGRIPVRGVFRTAIDDIDGHVVVVSLDSARALIGVPDGATSVVARLVNRRAVDAAADAVAAALSAGIDAPHEVKGWPTLVPMVATSVRYHEVTGVVVLVIFFVVVAASVANPILMSVIERTREYGVLAALGMTPTRLLSLVLCEAGLIGGAGVALGNVLGTAATAYFGRTGIDLSAFEAGMRTMPGLSDVVYPVVSGSRATVISVLVFLTACLVAVYPAARAARLDPVEAMRGIAGSRLRARRHQRPTRGSFPFVRMAARNLTRNPQRSAIATGGTGFTILAFVFLFAYFDGFGEQAIENSTRYLTGHIQLERAGFRRDYPPALAVPDGPAIVQRVRAIPNVSAAAPRIQAQALASSAVRSEAVLLVGIEPAVEQRVTFIDRAIVEGAALAPGADRGIVIGQRLAGKLRAHPGEKLVVMSQDAAGELSAAAFTVTGLFATESAYFDDATVFVTRSDASALLTLGDRISTINVRLTDRTAMDQTIADLQAAVAGTGLTVVPWQELLPQIDQTVSLIRVMRGIVLGIVLIVVALALMNTLLMAVAERTRELGVLLALGASPMAIVRMVAYETFGLLLIATTVGLGAGIVVVQYFAKAGLDLSRFFQGYAVIPGLTGVTYPVLFVGSLIAPLVMLSLVGLTAALYPATKASRLDPVRAIHHA